MIKNPPGNGHDFHDCPARISRQSGHRCQRKQVDSKYIPRRTLRTNKSPCWFDKSGHLPHLRVLKSGTHALRRLLCYFQTLLHDSSTSSINPTHCVGRVTIDRGCRGDSGAAVESGQQATNRPSPPPGGHHHASTNHPLVQQGQTVHSLNRSLWTPVFLHVDNLE